MKPVTVSVLKKELTHLSQEALIELCLKLAKFKKENKELLSYVLFNSSNEQEYIKAIKEEIDSGFTSLNLDRLYFIKKGTRKILRVIKKHIRYSKKKETEVELLLYFCMKLSQLKPSYKRSQQMINMYQNQIKMARNAISGLHEDLQYDLTIELEKLVAQ